MNSQLLTLSAIIAALSGRKAPKIRTPKVPKVPNSVILFEDDTRIVVATGIQSKSDNTKTGGMIQIYILHRTVRPVEATKVGADSEICGNCPHRGQIIDGKLVGRRCYVNVGQAPTSIFSAYHRGSYRHATIEEYPALFGGRLVRFGAYGDPVYIPLSIIEAIASVAKDWTGYTHQWRDDRYAGFKPYVMASADSVNDATDAIHDGWRYFRVAGLNQPELMGGEISCPASKEAGKKTTCDKCKLCNGKKSPADARKNIVILDHSAIAKTQPMSKLSASASAFTIL